MSNAELHNKHACSGIKKNYFLSFEYFTKKMWYQKYIYAMMKLLILLVSSSISEQRRATNGLRNKLSFDSIDDTYMKKAIAKRVSHLILIFTSMLLFNSYKKRICQVLEQSLGGSGKLFVGLHGAHPVNFVTFVLDI